MKKYVVFAAFCTTMVACGSNDGNKGATDKPAESGSNATAPAAGQYEKGLEMIGALDCTTCHKISEKNIGPAYTEVAQKYEANDNNIEMLSQKIIKGGSGNWGTVPMTPHPAVSVDSAKEMVRYILSLKNQ